MVVPPMLGNDSAIEASDEDIERALANALRRAGGRSVEELAAQTRSVQFTSPAAMRAWVVVRTPAS